jgi:hypothetical protein
MRCCNCGDPNYLRNNCPKPRRIEQGLPAPLPGNNRGPALGPTGSEGQKPQVKAKVFALNREELRADVTVVEGMFTIHGCSITTLIDPNSTYSFINETCACHLDWFGEKLSYVLHVSTPLGKLAMANKYVPGHEIQVGREALKADLIVMPIEDYDFILRID